MPAPMPVIVGAPRSGTTLLRLMLDAHPDLAIPPETGFFSALPAPDGRSECTADWFMDFITTFPPSAPAWADFGVSADTLRECVEALHPLTLADGFRCFYRLYAERHSKPRWGDKTPTHALRIAAIARLLPEARITHVIRDGRDAAHRPHGAESGAAVSALPGNAVRKSPPRTGAGTHDPLRIPRSAVRFRDAQVS